MAVAERKSYQSNIYQNNLEQILYTAFEPTHELNLFACLFVA